MPTLPVARKRLKLISCEIFHREMCAVVARAARAVDVEFLPKGLHDIGQQGMVQRLQEAIDRVDPDRYDTILLGYALCNNGICGLAARALPIILPRAHDCITLFFGSHRRYLDYFNAHPGTYFLTTGWLERGGDLGDLQQLSIQHQMGMDLTFEELVARYGEDNARYLYDQLCNTLKNYGRYAWIEMGVEPDGSFEDRARGEAADRGWSFEKVQGDMGLIQRLVNGPWDEREFLLLPPGRRVAPSHGDDLIRLEPQRPAGQ